ncbi:hypothetical protein SUGI_0020570 [Cryptomeria japonica]|nr:hypothetical protein SUGI_0020570 [Cryptomeria japonica]
MVHHLGVSCMWRDESLCLQCRRLFYTDERVFVTVKSLVECILGVGKHWCDGFVYEVVISPLVDILDAREVCIQRIGIFIRAVDGQAVANALLEEAELGASIYRTYFNPANYISSDSEGVSEDDGDSEFEEEDKEAEEIKAEKQRRRSFIEEAWEVYRVGVFINNLIPFQRVLGRGDNWLSTTSTEVVVDII